jgi:2-methylcitrate dehydratase PrpD
MDGQIGLASFSDEQVMRSEAQDLIPRIEMRRHPGYEGQTSWTEAHNRVEVHLKDGRVLSERADRATTGALRGVTHDDVRTKFRDCAAIALNAQDSDEALTMLDGLEDVGPVGPLAELLGG